MNKFFLFIINRHQEILRYLIILAAVVIISYLFPKIGIFKYDFEIGKPWKYETLIAPFNLGIPKSEEDLAKETELVLHEFSPYYRLNIKVYIQKRDGFIKNFNEKQALTSQATLNLIKIDSALNINYGLQVLEEIYDKGIVNLDDQHKSYPETKPVNIMMTDNTAEIKRISDLLSIKGAFELVRKRALETKEIQSKFLLPLLEDAIAYNIFYDDSTTRKFKSEVLQNISFTRGMIQEGEMIISKGAIVTPEKFQVLVSFKQEYEQRILGIKKSQVIYLGNVLLTLIILVIFSFFLKAFSPEVFQSNRKLLLVFLLITLMIVSISSIMKTDLPILYAIPVCIVPIILKTFFGANLALHAHLALVLLSAFIVPQGIEFLFLQLIAGMVAIFTNIRAYYWSQFFLSNAFILVAYLSGYFAISIIQQGSFEDINLANFGWLTLNVLLTLLAYPLIPVFEKLFGFISEITLLELSDINKPLLKDLSIKAPGTFQHSLQVANLAEASAFEVGANNLLVKVGALYHDIGKMQNPLYFIENQHSDVNPHDDLTFEESAKIIIGHVKQGIKMAKKHNLPDILVDFIRTHHGTTMVQYFYQSYLKNYPDKVVDETKFCYPGPLPYSKETAIVMMADSVEAAARSLKNPSNEDIHNLVEKIINHKIEQNQFINSNITFKEITTVKKVLKKMLNSMYHVRIAYPESVS